MTGLQTWTGHYFDGKSPIANPVSIQLTVEGLHIHKSPHEVGLFWPYQEIRQTQGTYVGEEIRLEHVNDQHDFLVVHDANFLSALHQYIPHSVKHLHNPHHRFRRIGFTIAAGFLALPLLWIVYAKGVPTLARPLTSLIPYSWESRLGAALAEKIAPAAKRCTDIHLLEKIDAIVHALVSSVETPIYTFQLAIVDEPILNALALPGGHIIVFRGLVETTETAEELAGVLAHEMQHILHRHGMHLLVQNITLGLLIGALTGDISGVMAFILEGAHVLQSLSYSRTAEEEADREGMQLLLASGINPHGMITFFEYLLEQQNESTAMWRYLSTHPTPEERVAKLRAEAMPAQVGRHRLFPFDDWHHIRSLCHEVTNNMRL